MMGHAADGEGTVLRTRGVSKAFDGYKAVDDCSLAVRRGSVTGLIGPNGAGKTTLFGLIGGSVSPTSGTVELDGVDLTRLRPDERFRMGLARTFQIPHEFSTMTALENLMTVPPDQPGESLFSAWFRRGAARASDAKVTRRARDVLDFLGLTEVHAVPAGHLSGGQRKLLELGRCLMSDAKVILLDEPAAGVNRTLLADVSDRIRALHRDGHTLLIIEHDLDFLGGVAEFVHVMAEGSILMSGTMAEVRANRTVQDAYLGSPLPGAEA